MQTKQFRIIIGLLLSIVSFFFFSVQDALAKFAGQMYTPLAVGFYIRLFSSLAMISVNLLRRFRGVKDAFHVVKPASQIIRGFLVFFLTYGFTSAFILLPLSNAYTVVFTLPIFTAIFGRLFFKEHISPKAVLAIAVGFLGILVALRPGSTAISIGYAFVFAAVIVEAPMFLLIRYFHKDDHVMSVIMYPSILATLCFLIIHAINGMDALMLVSPYHLLLFITMGIVNVLAQYCMVASLGRLAASISASMQYTQIIWGAVFDVLFFHTSDFTMFYILGTILVIFSSYWVSRIQTTKAKLLPDSSD